MINKSNHKLITSAFTRLGSMTHLVPEYMEWHQ